MTKKTSFGPKFDPIWPEFGPPNFFSKIWIRQSLDIMVSYHHVQYRKTDGQTDEQTDESDFIGRSPTNVECPTR